MRNMDYDLLYEHVRCLVFESDCDRPYLFHALIICTMSMCSSRAIFGPLIRVRTLPNVYKRDDPWDM